MMNRIVAVLVLVGVGVMACTMVAPAPQALLAKNDHKAVAAWYEHEAAMLREKAHEMEVMEEEYRQDPERGRQLMVHAPKADFIEACKQLATMYTNAAKQAESLATFHRSMVR
jgi:hypothetical protein